MKRWMIRVISIDSAEQRVDRFTFRRNAVNYGRSLASPLYDVVLQHESVDHVEVLSRHVDPKDFLARGAS